MDNQVFLIDVRQNINSGCEHRRFIFRPICETLKPGRKSELVIIWMSDVNFVARVLERNETPITATIKLFNFEKRRRLIVINKRRVETAFSQEIIGKQLYEVIMSPN